MSRKLTSKLATGALGAGAALALGVSLAAPAAADPVSPYHAYAAVGSDTLQDLFNNFATVSANDLDSWDAFGTTPIKTKAVDGYVTRPAGSGDGRAALSAAWNPASHTWTKQAVDPVTGASSTSRLVTVESIDIARSSGQPGTQVPAGAANDNLTSVPLARDAVAVAVGSSVKASITNLTTSQLRALYSCGTTFTDGTVTGYNATTKTAVLNGTTTVHIQIPQSGSGTRSFFLTALGLTGPGTCVDDSGFPENSVSAVASNGVIPFSAAQYIAQFNGRVTPTAPIANIGLPTIDSRPIFTLAGFPQQASPSTAGNSLYGDPATPIPAQTVGSAQVPALLSRDVYSVVPTNSITSGKADYDVNLATLVQRTLPTATSTISQYGFRTITFVATSAQVGNTSLSFYIHSPWEN